MRQELILI